MQPHCLRRIAVKRIISPYIQNLIVLTTKGRDEKRKGKEKDRINSFINHSSHRRGGGEMRILDINLPIFNPE